MVDYAITHVRYNTTDRRYIAMVIQRKIVNGYMQADEQVSKSTVVVNLNNRLIYSTVVLRNGSYQWGDNVITYNLRGTDYIRTDGNKTEEDNLGNLPTF